MNPRTDREFKLQRMGFLQGAIAATGLYAVWRDGKQYVGILYKPLTEALKPYSDELSNLIYLKDEV